MVSLGTEWFGHAPDGYLRETRMKIDGRCHCGEITFEAEVDPDALNICHCTIASLPTKGVQKQ
jgi:hypothetical protein